MHEKLKEVSKRIGVGKAGQRAAGWVKWRGEKTLKEAFFLTEEEEEQAFFSTGHLPCVRMCVDRQVEADASEVSFYVSWDRVDDP